MRPQRQTQSQNGVVQILIQIRNRPRRLARKEFFSSDGGRVYLPRGNGIGRCIIIRVRGYSNGLTNHPGGDVYRGLLMHAELFFDVVCCCCCFQQMLILRFETVKHMKNKNVRGKNGLWRQPGRGPAGRPAGRPASWSAGRPAGC